MGQFSTKDITDFESRLFIAVIRQAEREKDMEFLTGKGIMRLGDYLGIDDSTCLLIKEKFIRKQQLLSQLKQEGV